MSEFEKKLNIIICNGVTIHDEKFYLFSNLVSFFKDWQPPKKLVEVPQIVADWFEINKFRLDENIKSLARILKDEPKSDWNEMDNWFMKSSNNPVETLIRMKTDGYTVEEEKLYLLKHIEISNRDTTINCYLTHTFTAPFIGHTNFSKGYDMSDVKECHFKQSEIDDMETGSYEQIPVEMSDNGI